MKNYTVPKDVSAKPMSLGEYNALRGWAMPKGEDPYAKGYLTMDSDGGKPNHPDFEHYITWVPADVFERNYTADERTYPATFLESNLSTQLIALSLESLSTIETADRLCAFINEVMGAAVDYKVHPIGNDCFLLVDDTLGGKHSFFLHFVMLIKNTPYIETGWGVDKLAKQRLGYSDIAIPQSKVFLVREGFKKLTGRVLDVH